MFLIRELEPQYNSNDRVWVRWLVRHGHFELQSTIEKEMKAVDRGGSRLMKQTIDKDDMAIEYIWFNESLSLPEQYFWLNSSKLPHYTFKANH